MTIIDLLHDLKNDGQLVELVNNDVPGRFTDVSQRTANTLNSLIANISDRIIALDDVPIDRIRIRAPAAGAFYAKVPDILLNALLRLAAVHGVELGVEWFNRLVSKRLMRERIVIGIHGLMLRSETDVSGVRLLPLSELSRTEGVRAWLARAIADPQLFHLYAVAVLEHEVPNWLPARIDNPDFVSLSEWRQRCDTILKAIGYAEGGSPSLGECWGEYIDEDFEQLGIRSGYTWVPENAPRPIRAVALTHAGIEAAKNHLAREGQLRAKLDLAAGRLALARRRIGDADRAIDTSIALEALLGDDKFDLTYKLGLRSARILGSSLDERRVIRGDIKKFYNVRSKIVHGNTENIKPSDIEYITKAIEYCSRLLMFMAKTDNVPDWDEIELQL